MIGQELPLPTFEFKSRNDKQWQVRKHNSEEFREGKSKSLCGVFQQRGQVIEPINLFVVYDGKTCSHMEANNMANLILQYLNVRQFEKMGKQTLMVLRAVFSVDMKNEETMHRSFERYDAAISAREKNLIFGILPQDGCETVISSAKQDLTRVLTLDSYKRGYLTQFIMYKNITSKNAVWGAAEDCLLKADFELYKMNLNMVPKDRDKLFEHGKIWVFGCDTTKLAGNNELTVFTICGAREPLVHSMKGYEFATNLLPKGVQIAELRCATKVFQKVLEAMIYKQAKESNPLSIFFLIQFCHYCVLT